MRILSIETSCDETGIALVEAVGNLKQPRFKIVKNLVSSQIPAHRPFGGVVPNLAKREHLKNLPILLKKLSPKPYTLPDIIAVTVGPGLEPALWAGITFAKELAKKYRKPLIGANHLHGHLYSFLLPPQKKSVIHNSQFIIPKVEFPAIALLVSGGHTILLKMDPMTKWKKLGETRDDAAGEAFDKVARMLGLPYPGGPEIEKTAKRGDSKAVHFPRPMLNQKNYDFSFSGLKTSVFYYLNGLGFRVEGIEINKKLNPIPYTLKANVAASFQEAVVDTLAQKTLRAAREYRARSIILCGGVAANRVLRSRLKTESKKLGTKFFVPAMEYNGDNAAMIAAAGYLGLFKKRSFPLRASGDLTI